jgi:tRNA threonylcarbamoyl adenosine modification protein YeaZ
MTLFIDSTQKKLNIALIENKQILDYYSINTNNNLTDVAVEKIMKLLKKNKIKKQQIDKIYLTIGPGSFTGVRVGCLIAKA